MSRSRPVAVVIAALCALLVLSACTAGDPAESSAGAASVLEGDGEGEDAAMDDSAEMAQEESAEGGDEASAVVDADTARAQLPAPEGRMIARDASVAIVVEDITEGAAQARAAAAAAEGYVVSEEVAPATEDEESSGYALIVLSVPSAELDAVIGQVSDVGTVRSTRLTSEDVTEQFVDTSARVSTQRASIDRVRALLEEAADIEDVVNLERELSTREADLDALLAVQQSLEADVSRSTLTVELSTEEEVLAATEEPRDGFVAGLQRGWDAFGATTAVLLTGVGAMLPFLIALGLILVPVVAITRRRGPRGSAPAAPPA